MDPLVCPGILVAGYKYKVNAETKKSGVFNYSSESSA
jgi:hypothetical protein